MRARLFGTPQPAADSECFDLTLCVGAEDAVQAVLEANAEGRPFSVAFLDMRMPPGPDGVWAATRIRELDSQLDIVIVTAYCDIDPEEITRRVPPAGSLFYLQKPFHAHEVRQLASALGSAAPGGGPNPTACLFR
jgi:CheY-like chemotaxis protein